MVNLQLCSVHATLTSCDPRYRYIYTSSTNFRTRHTVRTGFNPIGITIYTLFLPSREKSTNHCFFYVRCNAKCEKWRQRVGAQVSYIYFLVYI